MYAVIKTGGKQYKVVAGEKLKVEQIPASIGEAVRLMKENKIGGIPIVDGNHKLVGILTNRDLRFEAW